MRTRYTLFWTIALAAISINCCADNLEFNEGNLQYELLDAFTNNNTKPETCYVESGKIASACFPPAIDEPIADKRHLFIVLTNQFALDGILLWNTNQQIVASIANEVTEPFFNKPPNINLDRLAVATVNALSEVVTGNVTQIEAIEYPLARLCTNSFNQTDLFQNLTNSLARNDTLGLTEPEQTLVASNIAENIFPEGIQALQIPGAYTLAPDTNGTARWLISFSSGAQFLNPFVISVPSGSKTGIVTNNGSTTVGYLQFDVMRRWVLAPTFSTVPTKPSDGLIFNDKDLTPDCQFDMGFYFENSTSSSNPTYSAQTLAGSDIYMNLFLAEHIWRNSWQPYDKVAVQASLGGSIGVTTEHSFEELHPNYFAGLILDAGLPYGFFQDTNVTSVGLVECRIGAGHVEYPSMVGTDNEVNLNGNGVPEYHGVWSPEMSADILVPFGKAIYLNVEANAFICNQTPNQWNVKVGVTVPWATIGKELSFLGLGSN